ncbi:MAG: nucleotidyltransferase [Rubrivivax sp.]|nr:nucleotidyltransferase [Rubrivivax sp.]
MLTIDEAFRKFKSRLELNDREQKNAIARHTEVREYIRSKFAIERDFLTGSYKRHTKTKPLKDIDIFFVMKESERHYRSKAAGVVLDDYEKVLIEKYGKSATTRQSRSINIDFGVAVKEEDKTDYKVLSIDVVPAFSSADDYEIPDGDTGKWIKTNPEVHAEKATQANQAYSSEWKGLVRMVKYWNNNKKHGEKPIKPSFLIEVMALESLHGGWGGQFDRVIQSFFATLADRIGDTWTDPAGLGPPISAWMDASRVATAKRALSEAARQAGIAINHLHQGRNGEALKVWRELFGPMFPLS